MLKVSLLAIGNDCVAHRYTGFLYRLLVLGPYNKAKGLLQGSRFHAMWNYLPGKAHNAFPVLVLFVGINPNTAIIAEGRLGLSWYTSFVLSSDFQIRTYTGDPVLLSVRNDFPLVYLAEVHVKHCSGMVRGFVVSYVLRTKLYSAKFNGAANALPSGQAFSASGKVSWQFWRTWRHLPRVTTSRGIKVKPAGQAMKKRRSGRKGGQFPSKEGAHSLARKRHGRKIQSFLDSTYTQKHVILDSAYKKRWSRLKAYSNPVFSFLNST